MKMSLDKTSIKAILRQPKKLDKNLKTEWIKKWITNSKVSNLQLRTKPLPINFRKNTIKTNLIMKKIRAVCKSKKSQKSLERFKMKRHQTLKKLT